MVAIDDEELIALTASFVDRASENPPGDEATVASFLVDRLESSPVSFEVDRYEVKPGRPNVVARAGNPDHGSVLLTGHTDVVPADPEKWSRDPYELHHDGEFLVGRGTADMKGALAAKIVAAESFLTVVDEPGEVVLGFVVDEEFRGRGTQAMLDRGVTADWAIVGEPTSLDVCVAEKGVARFDLTVTGRSAHSGRPDQGVNSIDGMRRLLERIERFHNELGETTDHPLLAPETITTTEIESVGSPNTVPNRTKATVDWRFLPGTDDNAESFIERFTDAISGATLNGTPVNFTVEQSVFARAREIDADHELVDATVSAAAEAGCESDRVGFNAATDARFLAHDGGIPTVIFGPGSIENDAHTVDESIRVNELVRTAETYRYLLDRLVR
jgi:acetylornithine deacetylase/succinyl-diaminopimelate desuccinylase family protein